MASQRKSKTEKTPPQDEAAAAEQPAPPPPKKRGKLLIIVGALLVAAAGGGAAFYFMHPTESVARAVVAKPPVFLPLEAFTVNLAADGGQMQFMQAGITLKLAEKATADLIKDRLPEVRNRMLIVLSSKRASEILSVAGKQKLAGEIAEGIKKVITPPAPPAPAPVAAAEEHDGNAATAASPPAAPAPTQAAPAGPEVEVLFTSFIIQ